MAVTAINNVHRLSAYRREIGGESFPDHCSRITLLLDQADAANDGAA
jgi:hypothetical protein